VRHLLPARPRAAGRGGGEELNREQKAEAIAAIAERLSTTDTVIATAFHGLSVREVEDLRGALREADAHFQVVKNTLARRACDETGREALLEYLEGQTALVWANGDPAMIAKALNSFAKSTEDRLSMKGGILDGAPISAGELKQLAALPPRDELLARLVGGATEETIIARVGEGIVSTIGSSETHKQVLENPDRISKGVLSKGLDAGTAFEILSIDIADVVGGNLRVQKGVGAKGNTGAGTGYQKLLRVRARFDARIVDDRPQP